MSLGTIVPRHKKQSKPFYKASISFGAVLTRPLQFTIETRLKQHHGSAIFVENEAKDSIIIELLAGKYGSN